MKKDYLNSTFKIILSFIFLFIIFLVLDFLFPLDYDRLKRPLSAEIYSQDGQLLRMTLSKDGYWRKEAKDIPQLIKKSLLLFEDKYFYYHFGINPASIFRAFFHNLKNSNKIGASTISMQVARMMQRRERTYKNKFIELFETLQLEWHFNKDEILNFYFNLAPYGGNIEGIAAASYFYFKRDLKDLSIAQVALLVSIPKNPNQNRLDRQKGLKEKRKKILNLLLEAKIISKSAFLRALVEPIAKKRFQAPFLAPHYTNIALEQSKTKITALNSNIQNYIEKLLKTSVNHLRHLNVNNASAVLINNETMEVVSYVGSDNFNSKDGQNDGVLMIRSPGSTLKPFIYANAFDNGLTTPKRKIFDVPIHIGFYEPNNFHKNFLGEVSTEEALQFSLNIPAVTLNKLLENNSLFEILKKAKITSIDREKEYYGDGIALGGFGISLLDLTHLYTAFSNDGKLLPLNYAGKIKDINTSLMSKESAWIVSEILADGIRAELSEFWQSNIDIPKVGFKTGTSADFKDLYTIAFSKKYTLGIWMGNFDGKKTENLTGIDTAAKLSFRIFRHLNNIEKLKWLEKPKNVEEKLICTDSIIINECKNYQYDYTIKNLTIKRPCKFLRAEVLAFLVDQKKIKSINDLSENVCFYEWKERKPVFVSPYHKAEILLNKREKIMLKCYSFDENEDIYFKIDDKNLIQAKSADELFISLDEGYHNLSCIDSSSRSIENEIKVNID